MIVMAGLVPAIHVFLAATVVKSWMPGSSPGMTSFHAPHQFIVGIENSAPSLTPEGQRAVTVLVLV
jgi:hypothetical protein